MIVLWIPPILVPSAMLRLRCSMGGCRRGSDGGPRIQAPDRAQCSRVSARILKSFIFAAPSCCSHPLRFPFPSRLCVNLRSSRTMIYKSRRGWGCTNKMESFLPNTALNHSRPLGTIERPGVAMHMHTGSFCSSELHQGQLVKMPVHYQDSASCTEQSGDTAYINSSAPATARRGHAIQNTIHEEPEPTDAARI